MQKEGEIVQPRPKKNRADLADELEFFMELRNKLMKERCDSSNSYCSFGTQKGLGFVGNRIKVLCKRLGITAGTAHSSPAISDPTDPLEKHVNDLSSTIGADPIQDDGDGSADGCGDEEEEDEMEWGKPAMEEEEEVRRITGPTPMSEIDAEAVVEADAQVTDVSENLVLKPDSILTNTTAKVPINDDGHAQADAMVSTMMR
uniref:Uncharacterized protein n=1 Tax=Triticum urartu TaxID=4572 RepID=A0A8R7TQD9_TRIUA